MTTSIESFAALGRLFREYSAVDDFAESIAVTDIEILAEVRSLLEEEIGNLDRLTSVTIDPDADKFQGQARQRISLSRFQTYQFSMSPDAIEYRLIDAEEVAQYAESDEGWTEILEFAAKSKSAKASKKLNCKPGNTQCGGKCQDGKKNCRFDPPPEKKEKIGAVAAKAKKVAPAKAKKVATAKPKTETNIDAVAEKTGKATAETKSADDRNKKPVVNQAELDKRRKRLAKTYGEDAVRQLENKTKQFLEESEVFVRVRSIDTLEKIIGGRFKSQFETNTTSSGLLDSKVRSEAEQRLFGYDKKLDPADRPIYGYLARPQSVDSDEAGDVSLYGTISVRLRSEIKDRTTFTADDSLSRAGIGSNIRAYAPSPVNNPNAASTLSLYEGKYRTSSIDDISNGQNLSDLRSSRRSSYVEAQVHGQVQSSDIAEIVFTSRSRPSAKITEWAKANNVEIRIIDEG